MGALSFYDTAPLKATLEELVDFDLINRKQVRLTLGAVNLRNGNSVYFDNSKMRIGAEHVLASGALPPGFPIGDWFLPSAHMTNFGSSFQLIGPASPLAPMRLCHCAYRVNKCRGGECGLPG